MECVQSLFWGLFFPASPSSPVGMLAFFTDHFWNGFATFTFLFERRSDELLFSVLLFLSNNRSEGQIHSKTKRCTFGHKFAMILLHVQYMGIRQET